MNLRGEGVRVDSGVEEGGEISMYYDPMIAKLVAYASIVTPRSTGCILHWIIMMDGIACNRQFLSAVLENEAFRSGQLTTGFIAEEFDGDFVAEAPSR